MRYLNCAATSHVRPPAVTQAVLAAFTNGGSYGRGGYGPDLDAAREVERTRNDLARFFGAAAERVCFTANATMSLNVALSGLLRAGDHVIATDWDHNSVLRCLTRLERERGIRSSFVPAHADGTLDLATFENLFEPSTRVVVITHASNVTGEVAPVANMAEIAHAHGALVVVDAAQTAGMLPCTLAEIGADVVCATGHKALMGPQGTGVLIAGDTADIQPLLCGGTGTDSINTAQPDAWPERLEAGTLNVPGIAGLGAGVRWIEERGLAAINAHENALIDRLIDGVSELSGVHLYGPAARGERPNTPIVSLTVDGWDCGVLADELARRYRVMTRAGLHCAPRMHRALGTEKSGTVRFSLGALSTELDVDAAVAALAELVGGGR